MSDRMRIGGMASGMDTDASVKQMMKPYNMRLDKMKQDKQVNQWRQEIYRDVIKDLRDLRNNYLMVGSPDATNMMKSNSYSGSTFTSSVEDSNKVTATALPGAANGTTTVAIKQVATGAKVVGTKLTGLISGEVTNAANFGGAKITINGETLTLGASADMDALVSSFKTAIDGNANLKDKISVEKANIDGKNYLRFIQTTDTAVTITSAKKADSSDLSELSNLLNKPLKVSLTTKLSDLGIENKSLSIKLSSGTGTFTIDNTKTVQDMINTIYNTKIGTTTDTLYSKIKVNFSELTGSLNIETRDTGASQSLDLSSSDAATLGKLGLKIDTVPPAAPTIPATIYAKLAPGQDAKVSITPPGGASVDVIKSTNSFTIDNIAYNINPSYIPKVDDIATLTSKPDSQKSYDKIKGFVDKYNTIVQKMYDKYTEKKQYKLQPLTDEQKSAMKDDDIKNWEAKVKTGLVKNDNELSGIMTSMRSAFFDEVKGAGISLKEIGLDSYGGFDSISKPGQIKLDEKKLKAALETKGDQVMKLLTASPDSSITDSTEKYKNTGVLQRIKDILYDSVEKFDGSLLKKAGFEGTMSAIKNDLTDKIKEQDKKIQEMVIKLSTKEDKFYEQFSKLETYMNKMNSQSSWLAQQLGGGK